ncbi:hypothetical protein BOTNAR_0155g00210 [Botryotinia narcissicola]|uniref:Uncharacterized protein n=1 Tax=Botryotinia narcissicola TaxID=278944 RepID=A0A4Z1IDW6_9HELO|nr:hypothetical protein BOTNAR_0155g00210 [Botryotinia narcissicola]
MNKIKYQRVDQPIFLEVDHVQVGGHDWSIEDTHRVESPINNKSPTEELSEPGMSQSQYFEDQIDIPPHRNAGLPLQPVPLDWDGLPSMMDGDRVSELPKKGRSKIDGVLVLLLFLFPIQIQCAETGAGQLEVGEVGELGQLEEGRQLGEVEYLDEAEELESGGGCIKAAGIRRKLR